jgi:hypothetical protein
LYWQLFISNRNPIKNILRAHCINHWPKLQRRFRFGAIFCASYYVEAVEYILEIIHIVLNVVNRLMDHLHYRLNFDLDQNFITAWKSITKLVIFQSFVAKCCKMRII